jgi:RNA polymerase sigma factor (sigma-70 family)
MSTDKSESVALRRTLASLVNNNGRKWLRFIAGILRSDADAEDVFQEAVRRVLNRNLSFPSEEDVKRYLGRAIGNTAFEMYNHRKRERLRSIPIQESTLLYDNASGPDTCMVADEENRRKDRMLQLLDRALGKLPEKQEEAVRMTILETDGLSLRDIGSMHNIPYSTLRHRNKKGLERMRKFLERTLANEQRSKL